MFFLVKRKNVRNDDDSIEINRPDSKQEAVLVAQNLK